MTISHVWLLKVLGSVGHPIPLTEFKVVDSETGEILPPGSKGIIKVRGPPVMKGYYKVVLYWSMLIENVVKCSYIVHFLQHVAWASNL